MTRTITVVTGSFDPINEKHIELLTEIKQSADVLVVKLKPETPTSFMTTKTRTAILSNLRMVDLVLPKDGQIESPGEQVVFVDADTPDILARSAEILNNWITEHDLTAARLLL